MEWGQPDSIEWKIIPQDILYIDGLGTYREKRGRRRNMEWKREKKLMRLPSPLCNNLVRNLNEKENCTKDQHTANTDQLQIVWFFWFVFNKKQLANFSRLMLLFSLLSSNKGMWRQSAFCLTLTSLPGLDSCLQVGKCKQVIVIIVTAPLWPVFTAD